ncbi:MAG: amino acid synthesis family protein [Beijerinckiaceae bacterium]
MTSLIDIRRVVTITEDIRRERGPESGRIQRRAAVLAVMTNPYAGRYETDLLPMMEALKGAGLDMAKRCLDALGGDSKLIEGYGKGAIVGEAGELEHGALWHVPGGYAMRELLGGAKAIVPSTKKVGGPGARLDVPITHINAAYVRSHFDAMEVGVPGHPRADELVYVLVMSTGGRIHERIGGLRASEISVWDGQR